MLPPQVQRQPTNLRPNYSPLTRQLNPRLAAMSFQQQTPTDNVQPTGNLLPRSEIVQTPLAITDHQHAVRTDDLKPTNPVLVKQAISEGLETIDTPHPARNGDVQTVVHDSANRDIKQPKLM